MSEEKNDIIPDASVDITTVVCPTTFVKAGEVYRSATEFRFGIA